MKFFCVPYCSTLKVEAAHLSEILVNFMELHDVFSVITICEARILYS
jgi:hypothetical protein